MRTSIGRFFRGLIVPALIVGICILISFVSSMVTGRNEETQERAASSPTPWAREDLAVELSGVCSGHPFTGAFNLAPSPPHRLVIAPNSYGFDSTQEGRPDSDWNNMLPDDWVPDSPEEGQLVVCLEEENIELQVCKYFGSPITRYRTDLHVRVLEANSGVLAAQTTLEGHEPRKCKGSEPMRLVALYGYPSYSDLQAWLRQYVTTNTNAWSETAQGANAGSSMADKDMYCLPYPGASNEEAILVIKAGDTLIFTGNVDGDYSEVEAPRYVPTCWV